MNNILVIRMLELGDIASIAIPAIRHIQTLHPNANITCLTHGQGTEILSLAAPNVSLLTLEKGLWPENILPALEAFLGLAENIIESRYDQIINLDTSFMPCFLARFLKDAGEPVVGNYLSVSLQSLLDQLQAQTLQAEYVNQPQNYMQSTFDSMYKWHSQWWTGESVCDHGYPEFYLKRCCGWAEMEYDPSLLQSQHVLQRDNLSVYLALNDEQQVYDQLPQLTELLKNKGLKVVIDDKDAPLEAKLHTIASRSLVVCLTNAVFTFAACSGTPTLLIPLLMDPRILMPDYAADQATDIPNATSLSDSILSIFESD